jgi:putative salt-induced outer membrane protein YdiY
MIKKLLATLSLIIITSQAGLFAQTNAEPNWERSAATGATVTSGNSDTLLFTGNILAALKGKENEYLFRGDGTYGEADHQKNNESLHGQFQYNRLFSERVYGYALIDALHDAIADLDYRLTLSPGAGYYFIKNDKTRLSGEVGPGFVYEKQGGDTSGYFTLRLGEKFSHKFNDRAKIWQSFEILPQVDDFGNTIINAEIGIESSFTETMSLRTFLQDSYDTEPAPGRDRNDLKLVAAIAYKF